MRDRDHGDAETRADAVDFVEDESLRDDVESRRRLVEDQHFGSGGEGDCESEPLQLAPGELMGIAALKLSIARKVHEVQDLGDRALSTVGAAVAEYLRDLLRNAERRVERGTRALRDVRNEPSAEAPQSTLVGADHLVLVHRHGSADVTQAGPDPAEEGKCRRRLARSRFAGEPECLAGTHLERDRVDDRKSGEVLDVQVLDREDRAHRALRRTGPIPENRRCMPSANRLTDTARRTRTVAGAATPHGWSSTPGMFSWIIRPQSDAGG